jgi:hypothetical protein
MEALTGVAEAIALPDESLDVVFVAEASTGFGHRRRVARCVRALGQWRAGAAGYRLR